MSVLPKGAKQPIFGAVWVSARVTTDRDTRLLTCRSVEVPDAKFPNADPAKLARFKALLKREIPKWGLTISLDRLTASMDALEPSPASTTDLETRPPKILFVKEPAVLVTLDGEPQLREAEGQGSTPKVFLKFGANHVFDGRSTTNVLSLGNFVREIGWARGVESFNVRIFTGNYYDDGEGIGGS